MFFDMNTDSKTVNSQTAPASFDAAESNPNEIDLIKRLEEELARSRVRKEALMSLLNFKYCLIIENKRILPQPAMLD